MASRWSRKNILKQFGITIGTTFFPFSLWAKNETGEPLILHDNPFTSAWQNLLPPLMEIKM